jgi:hypothetical protein
MARTISPLHAIAAHGTIGKLLTFCTRRGKTFCRRQVAGIDYASTGRAAQRSAFLTAAANWHDMTPAEQNDFDGYDEKDD